jgi:hypothetical protein
MRRTALVLFALLLLGACGNASKSSAAGGPQSGPRPQGEPAGAGGPGGAASGGSGGSSGGGTAAGGASGGKVTADLAPFGRAVTRTATITVRVDDVLRSARAATAAAERIGGFVESEQSQLDRTSTLTMRVPPARFTSFGDELARLGTVVERRVSTDDVTGEVADVGGRLKAARASTGRLRALLGHAGSVTDIAAIENEVSQREAEIESLEARQRALADETALATVTLTLQKPDPAPPVVRKAGAPHGFAGGLRSGWHAFTAVVSVALVVTGALLPFLVTAAVLAVPLVVYARRKRAAAAA